MTKRNNWPRISAYALEKLPDGTEVIGNLMITGWRTDVGQNWHRFIRQPDGSMCYEVWHIDGQGGEAVRVYPRELAATTSASEAPPP